MPGKGRPKSPVSDYKIGIHRNNGITYAITQEAAPETKRGRKEIIWGIYDSENNKFIPGKKFLSTKKEQRDKLIFPEGWNLSAIQEMEKILSEGLRTSPGNFHSRFWGGGWFMYKVAEVTGVIDDLQLSLGSGERVDVALSLAVFPYIISQTIQQFLKLQRMYKLYTETELTPQFACEFTEKILDEERMSFLQARADRDNNEWPTIQSQVEDNHKQKPEYHFVTVDSISCGSSMVEVKNGYYNEHLPLRQRIEVVVYSLATRLPVYYMELSGNIPDNKVLTLIAKNLEEKGFKDIVFITERGYSSLANIEDMVKSGRPLLTSYSTSTADIKDRIREVGGPENAMSNMNIMRGQNFYCKQWTDCLYIRNENRGVDKFEGIKTNLYFSPDQHGLECIRIDQDLIEQEDELSEIVEQDFKYKTALERKKLQNQYSLMSITFNEDGTIKKFSKNNDMVTKTKLRCGFHAIKTIHLDLTAEKALEVYGYRDEQEKNFRERKSDDTKIRTGSELEKRGRNFIRFIGLILDCYIKKVWETSPKLKKMFSSYNDIINEMQDISIDEFENGTSFVHPFGERQINICKEFGFAIPSKAETKQSKTSFKPLLPASRPRIY